MFVKSQSPLSVDALIADIVARDAPFYDPVISEDAIVHLNGFARSTGQLTAAVAYDQIVPTRCRALWQGQ